MFSINPIYPNFVTGGASKHLYNIASYLGKKGHTITLICTIAQGSYQSFTWSDNVTVHPVLPFKQPFPNPYNISPGKLAIIAEITEKFLKDADRFYIHDGELLLPFLHTSIPTIISYRDNVYPESVLGTFLSAADEIIAVSNYSGKVIQASACRLFPDLAERIHVIPNGIDFSHFHYYDSGLLAQSLGLDPLHDCIILHPHRPEQSKGLLQTLKVAEKLIKDYKINNLKVLVPNWISEMASPEEKEFYNKFRMALKEKNLNGHFVFHPWLSQERMPEYYSLGSLTLCLGSFVEAFGNTAYESLACGTPSIVARVGTHRTQLPDSLIDKVDYEDIETSANLVARIIQTNQRLDSAHIDQLKIYFDLDYQLKSYEEIILNCKKQPVPEFKPIQITKDTAYCLAPWCSLTDHGIYHDYLPGYYRDFHLETLLQHNHKEIRSSQFQNAGITAEELRDWYERTVLVPIRS